MAPHTISPGVWCVLACPACGGPLTRKDNGVYKETAEAYGFEWVGLDYNLPEAPTLATYNSLHNAGFEILHVSPAPDWPALVEI